MRKIKEVLRLRFEVQLGQREIARACSISQGAVHNYLKKAAAAGIGWPLPEDWDEKRIEETLFGDRHPIERRQRALPDFPSLHEQFQQHRHLTLQLVWEEYRQVHPEGYGYSRFCELYGRWLRKQDVVLRQNHKPGEKGFVDWAGRTIPIQDPRTGEIRGAALFLMVLGASNYTYAEATLDQQMAAWLRCHIHAFEYFGGVPRLLVPDNTRTGVSRACRYDPDLNPYVPGNGDALPRRSCPGTSPSSKGQGQSRVRGSRSRTLDHRRSASSHLLPARGFEPRDPGTAGKAESSTLQET